MSVYQGLLEASELGLGASFFRRQVLAEKSPQPPLPQRAKFKLRVHCVSPSPIPVSRGSPGAAPACLDVENPAVPALWSLLKGVFQFLAFMLSCLSSHLLSPTAEASHWVLDVNNHLCPRSARSGVFVPRTCVVPSIPVHLVCLTTCNWLTQDIFGHRRGGAAPGVLGKVLCLPWTCYPLQR